VDPELTRHLDLAWRAASRPAVSLAADELLDRALIVLAERHARLAVQRRSATDRPALTRVRDYLHASIGRSVRVDDLAGLASMSRFRLSRQFQEAFGLPLHAYHLHVRLEEARRRLARGESIASVACDLRFADQSHLHRRFKGAFGLTPGDWCAAAQRSKTSGRPSS
jgi:AraC-like DNA-binding protein